MLYTASTAFTNFGDGHRGTKQDAIVGHPDRVGHPGAGLHRVRPDGRHHRRPGHRAAGLPGHRPGHQGGLGRRRGRADAAADGARRSAPTGKVTAADGYTVLNAGQASARSEEITAFAVPTAGGAIRSHGPVPGVRGQGQPGVRRRLRLRPRRRHRQDLDRRRDAGLLRGRRRRAPGPGLEGQRRASTTSPGCSPTPTISGPFLRHAGVELRLRDRLGRRSRSCSACSCALALHSPRVRGRALYRILLILPYAMPSFAMLLVWRDMFNTDFGLINNLFGLDVDWFGGSLVGPVRGDPGPALARLSRTCSWSPPARCRRSRGS